MRRPRVGVLICVLQFSKEKKHNSDVLTFFLLVKRPSLLGELAWDQAESAEGMCWISRHDIQAGSRRLQGRHGFYPLENGPFTDDFPIKTPIYKGFSMAMLNN